MIKVTYDDTMKVTGFYLGDAVYANMPENYIEIDEDEHVRILGMMHDGELYISDINTKEFGIRAETYTKEQERQEHYVALKAELEKVKEDIEQVQYGLVREDYEEKRTRACEIINELRRLEGKEPRRVE